MIHRALPLLMLTPAALAGPPAVVPDPLGLGPTAVPHAWWGTEPLDAYASMGLVPPLVEPPLCGRFAAPRTYRPRPWLVYDGVIEGARLGLVRGDPVTQQAIGWQVLTGNLTYAGRTEVVGPAVLTVPPTLTSADLRLGRRSLLCVSGWTRGDASATTGSGTTLITWTALVRGAAGNALSVQLVVVAADSTCPVTCTVSDGLVTVTRAGSAGCTAANTARKVAAACPPGVIAAESTGSGLPAAQGPVALSGGVGDDPDPDGLGYPIPTPWTPAVGTTVTWSDPPAVLHVAGAITDASRLSLTVERAPTIYPTPLIEADGGITGTPTISSLPAGWQVRQTATTLYLEPIP